ncbi:unnamed protein product [Urochloa humidicola]
MGDQDPKRNKGKEKAVSENEDMAALYAHWERALITEHGSWDGIRNVGASGAGAAGQSAPRSVAAVVNQPHGRPVGQPSGPSLAAAPGGLQFRGNYSGQNAPRSAAPVPVVNLPHGRPAGQPFAAAPGGLQMMQAPAPSSLPLQPPPPRPAALAHYQQGPQIQGNYVYSRKASEFGKQMARRISRTATGPYARDGGAGGIGNLRFRENQNPGQNAPVVRNQPQYVHQQYRPMGHLHGGALGGSSSSLNPGAGHLQFQAPALGNLALQPWGSLSLQQAPMPPPQYQQIQDNSAQQDWPGFANRPAPPAFQNFQQQPPAFQNFQQQPPAFQNFHQQPPAFQNFHQQPPIPADGEVRPCPACPPPPVLPPNYSVPEPGATRDESRLCVACRKNPVPVPVPDQPPYHICVCHFCRSHGVVCSVCDFAP